MTDVYDTYVEALAAADAAAAATVLRDALGRGEARQSLIRDVVARGQRQVGQLWMDGTWTVADEHAATSVAEQSLGVIAPPRRAAATARRVAVACAEGEWHTLPARLAGELARASELDLTLLGGSIPAAHLQGHLRSSAPAVLALSVTMCTNLIGASRSIKAARDEGIPVVVGGAAWGSGQHRAHRLGAHLHLEDPAGLARAVQALDDEPVVRETSLDIPVEALLLDSPRPELLLAVAERHSAASTSMRTMSPYQRDRSVADLRWLARHAAAAIACDDPTIVQDLLVWLLALRTPPARPRRCHHRQRPLPRRCDRTGSAHRGKGASPGSRAGTRQTSNPGRCLSH